MPRPKNKEELLCLSQNNYRRLRELVDSFTPSQKYQEFSFEHRDRNIRDVLAHLHEWHLMMIQWYQTGMEGLKPDMPSKGYTWKTLPELNRKIWETWLNTPLERVETLFEESFQDIQNLIKKHSNEELFTKKFYDWTGSTSLGAYFISASSSHYDWGLKLLKKHKRMLDS